MPSNVYHIDLRTTPKRNLFSKLDTLLNEASIDKKIKKGDLTAVKLHFGEKGNISHIRPVIVREFVLKLKSLGAKPFLTDTNTLYTGERLESVSHLTNAIHNGFGYSCVEAPLVIADGLKGTSSRKVKIDKKWFKEVPIALEIYHSDSMAVLSHFKAHELTGFGGAIKNLGMGCSSREGKLAQHSSLGPKVIPKKCIECGDCIVYCPVNAINWKESKAFIEQKICIGCGGCIVICPVNAIQPQWNESVPAVQEKMAEHALGAIKGKAGRVIFVNFVLSVTPHCDCYGHSDKSIVPDVGILASDDPVAIDRASVDLVNAQQGIRGTALSSGWDKGGDKFKGVYPEIDWTHQFTHAESIGLGTTDYKLIKLEG